MNAVMQTNFDGHFKKSSLNLAYLDSPAPTRKSPEYIDTNKGVMSTDVHLKTWVAKRKLGIVSRKEQTSSLSKDVTDCGHSLATKDLNASVCTDYVEPRVMTSRPGNSLFGNSGASNELMPRERFTDENERVTSFPSDWSAPVSPRDLAAAGLYFTGPEDRVRCAWCGGCLYQWQEGDNPLEDHKRFFPECPYVSVKRQDFAVVNRSRTNRKAAESTSKRKEASWKQLDCVRAVVELGYQEKHVGEAVQSILRNAGQISSESIIDFLEENQNYFESLTSDLESQETTPLHENSPSQMSDFNCESDTIEAEEIRSFTTHESASSTDTRTVSTQSVAQSDSDITILGDFAQSLARKELAMHSLTEEMKTWKENMTCRVCLVETVGDLFLPCRHLACCVTCSAAVNRCPICRQKIVATIKTFIEQ